MEAVISHAWWCLAVNDEVPADDVRKTVVTYKKQVLGCDPEPMHVVVFRMFNNSFDTATWSAVKVFWAHEMSSEMQGPRSTTLKTSVSLSTDECSGCLVIGRRRFEFKFEYHGSS